MSTGRTDPYTVLELTLARLTGVGHGLLSDRRTGPNWSRARANVRPLTGSPTRASIFTIPSSSPVLWSHWLHYQEGLGASAGLFKTNFQNAKREIGFNRPLGADIATEEPKPFNTDDSLRKRSAGEEEVLTSRSHTNQSKLQFSSTPSVKCQTGFKAGKYLWDSGHCRLRRQ